MLKILVFWGVTLHRRVGFFEMSVDRNQLTQSHAPEVWIFRNMKLFCFVVYLATLSVSRPVYLNQGSADHSSGFCDELWNIYMNVLKYRGKIQISLQISREFFFRLFQILMLHPPANNCIFVLWPVNIHSLGFPGIRKIILRVFPWQKLSKLWSVL